MAIKVNQEKMLVIFSLYQKNTGESSPKEIIQSVELDEEPAGSLQKAVF